MTEEEAKKIFDEGIEFSKQKEYKKFIECLTKIPKYNSLYFHAQRVMGLFYKEQSNLKEATIYWLKITSKEYPFYNETQHNLGTAHFLIDQHREAIKYWVNVSEEYERYIDVQWLAALAYRTLEEFSLAIKHWRKIPPSKNYYNDAQFNIASVQIELKEYSEALKYFQNITPEDKYYLDAQWSLGVIYGHLDEKLKAIEYWTKILQNKKHVHYATALRNIAFLKSELDCYEEAIEYWKKIDPENEHYSIAQWNIGIGYNILGNPLKSIEHWANIKDKRFPQYKEAQWGIAIKFIIKENLKDACEALLNSKRGILGILYLFGSVERGVVRKTFIKKLFSKLLDSTENHEDFFNSTIKTENKDRKAYKEIFIQSLYIISLLHVNSEQEKQVAHYTKRSTAEHLLLSASPLRLGSIMGANDPKEGESLLDFLSINNTKKTDTPYQAFITCFTFNPQSLNQFRLYGKEDNKEATGISIVVNKELFNNTMNVNLSHAKVEFSNDINTEKDFNQEDIKPEKKHSLYRCIYLDPQTGKVISVGHKEEYSLYRENKTKEEVDKYNEEIQNILVKVQTEMEELRKLINNSEGVDHSIITELLLPLRHLTKHVAFKEEQECRIFDIELLKDNKKILFKDISSFSGMYIEYGANIADHTEKVFFAPMTDGLEQFEAFAKYKGLKFTCERCDHPFSIKNY